MKDMEEVTRNCNNLGQHNSKNESTHYRRQQQGSSCHLHSGSCSSSPHIRRIISHRKHSKVNIRHNVYHSNIKIHTTKTVHTK
jgi:hypothetical protein